jgi:hypothetical protein
MLRHMLRKLPCGFAAQQLHIIVHGNSGHGAPCTNCVHRLKVLPLGMTIANQANRVVLQASHLGHHSDSVILAVAMRLVPRCLMVGGQSVGWVRRASTMLMQRALLKHIRKPFGIQLLVPEISSRYGDSQVPLRAPDASRIALDLFA